MAKELRIKGGERILAMIRQFSATEKVVFGVLVLILTVSALSMLVRVNNMFMVPIPSRGGSLAEGIIGLPRLVNPVIAVSDTDRDISALIYAGLMRYSHGHLVGDLAKSYTISDDGLTYTFVLRDDIRFHDGTAVTTDDVEFTINKIQNPAIQSPRRVDWKDVTVEKVGTSEIRFTLKQPYAPFLNNFTVGILPKHIWKNVDANQFIFSQYNIEPIGAGPYELASIDRDNGGIPVSYNLVPFTRYQGGQAYISDISMHFFPNETTALDALKRGQIDSIAAVSSASAAQVATSTSNIHVLTAPLPRIFAIFLNQNNTVLANKEVRQALDMSLDKNSLIDSALGGYGVRVDGPVPFGTFTQTLSATTLRQTGTPTSAAATSSQNNQNKDAARKLLEKNGWVMGSDGIYTKTTRKNAKDKDGVVQSLQFSIATADAPELKQTAEFVRQEWRSIGVDVTVKVFESGDLTQDIIRQRKYDALLFGEVIGKDLDLYAFWHSSQRIAPGLNLSMYVNAKTDKLLEDARKTSDESIRLSKYAEFESLVKSDIPAIFLYSPNFIYIVPERLRGLSLNQVTTAWDRWNDVNEWYITTDSVWKFMPAVKK